MILLCLQVDERCRRPVKAESGVVYHEATAGHLRTERDREDSARDGSQLFSSARAAGMPPPPLFVALLSPDAVERQQGRSQFETLYSVYK